jgi:hypothetical protein
LIIQAILLKPIKHLFFHKELENKQHTHIFLKLPLFYTYHDKIYIWESGSQFYKKKKKKKKKKSNKLIKYKNIKYITKDLIF